MTMDGQPFNYLGLVVVAWMAFTYRGVVWEQPLLVRCGGGLCYGAVAGVEFRFRRMCNWTIVRNPYLVEITCMSAFL
jgi:predicted membrane protein